MTLNSGKDSFGPWPIVLEFCQVIFKKQWKTLDNLKLLKFDSWTGWKWHFKTSGVVGNLKCIVCSDWLQSGHKFNSNCFLGCKGQPSNVNSGFW